MDRREQRFKNRTAVTKEQALNFLCANDAAEQNCEANQCGERNSNGITQPRGAATPMNCVNPPLAGSRSLAAVILHPRFFSVPNLKAFCADFCAFKCAAQGGSSFPRTVRPVCRCVRV